MKLEDQYKKEKMCLADMMHSRDYLMRLSIKDCDFKDERHQIIFLAIMELYMKNMPIDGLVILEHLKSKDLIDAIGGADYISSILDAGMWTSVEAADKHWGDTGLDHWPSKTKKSKKDLEKKKCEGKE